MIEHPQHIRWVSFDVVGTLLYADPAPTAVYHRFAQAHGSRLSEREIGERFLREFRRSERSDATGGAAQTAEDPFRTSEEGERLRWQRLVARVLDDVDDPETCFRELFEYFAQPSAWTAFPDVAPTLMALQGRNHRLAVASNFDGRLHALCDDLPELGPVEVRVISSEVGYRKPSPRFYAALLHALGCPPEEVLMVGDDFESDVLAARSAGLQAVSLERAGPMTERGDIRDLRELIALLEASG